MKMLFTSTAGLTVLLVLFAGTSLAGQSHPASCSGSAKIDEVGAKFFGQYNDVDADFKCNVGFKKFKLSANKKIEIAGSPSCKSDGPKAFECSGPSTKQVQTSFTTKASHACAKPRLKLKVTAARKTFKLKGPC